MIVQLTGVGLGTQKQVFHSFPVPGQVNKELRKYSKKQIELLNKQGCLLCGTLWVLDWWKGLKERHSQGPY